MRRYLSLCLIALMFCIAVNAGCGGGSDGGGDSADSEQTESLNEDTGSYDPNTGGRGDSGNSSNVVDLSTIKGDYTAQNGQILTGKLGKIVKISIAPNATVTLRDADIDGLRIVNNNNSYENLLYIGWPGIECKGNAVIILEGKNTVTSFYPRRPGIYIAAGATLTIKGDGSLRASGNKLGNAGIGGGYELPAGNIIIDGGTITATGGSKSPGIGSCHYSTCGDITINGGIITATGDDFAAGIGSGSGGSCGNITIKDTVTRVTAVKGWSDRPALLRSIGAGKNGWCGTVNIGGKVGEVYKSPYIYPEPTKTVDLSEITSHYTAQNGELLTGTLGANVRLSIADGASVSIRDVTINGVDDNNCRWAGINCNGNATLILEGTNSVKGFHQDYPGIHVPYGRTLTIKGYGLLTADSNGRAAGIGSGAYWNECGNIVIEQGTITAAGGYGSAGIGGGYIGFCGDIRITGGTITATGGDFAAGIGGGCGYMGPPSGDMGYSSCGSITITDTVTKVTANAGYAAPYSIGPGDNCEGGAVTVGGKTGAISQSTYPYQP